MDLQLVKKGLAYTQKRKKWVFLLATLGLSGYGVYRVYHLPSVVEKRKRLLRILDALISLAEAVADSAEAIGVVSKDVKEFIQSDSDQIPNSLRQISKITGSEEFSGSVSGMTRAFVVGILRAYRSEEARNADSVTDGSSSLAEKVLDKLLSTTGSGFAAVVVGSFARNLVMAFYSNTNEEGHSLGTNASSDPANLESLSRVIDIVCNDKCKGLIGDCIQLFVSTGVSTFLDKTSDINIYDDIFTALTNPKHENKMRELLALICNGSVETLVRTSHQVLTSKSSNVGSNSDSSGLASSRGDRPTKIKFDRQELLPTKFIGSSSFDGNQDGAHQDGGWAKKMSSTLAVPGNRRFVLDMTGRVTFEIVRFFLEFFLEKIYKGIKSNLNIVHAEVIDRGLEVLRYATAKSSTVATICLSVCLHMLNGPWILVPA